MQIPQSRRAVSPIIATLLLIAIAVAAGIIVYVFVGSLSGSLTKSGGNQVTESLSEDAYTSSIVATNSSYSFVLVLRNTGSSAVTISSVYFDGSVLTVKAPSNPPVLMSVAVQGTITLRLAQGFTLGSNTSPSFSAIPATTAGSSHQVKVVTTDGGSFAFNLVSGSSG